MQYIYSVLVYLAIVMNVPGIIEAAKPFIVCDLQGQLGNQLFQIATAVSMAKDNDAIPLFPDLNDLHNNIKINFHTIFNSLNASKPPRKISTFYKESSLRYQRIPYTPDMRIRGYFQCEEYFKHYRELILKLFAPSPTIVAYLQEHYGDIISNPKTVSIHVRTYVKEQPNVRKNYVLNGRSYVQIAMSMFPADSHFIVFSDDIKWCKQNLSDLAPHMRFIEGESYFYDFYLQSLCKHNIISNSSFSWWAAWLNKNPGKIVVAPKHWFTSISGMDSSDIVPTNWIQVGKE